MLGQVHATGLTVPQLRDKIQELYRKYYKNPAITVTPLRVKQQASTTCGTRSTVVLVKVAKTGLPELCLMERSRWPGDRCPSKPRA